MIAGIKFIFMLKELIRHIKLYQISLKTVQNVRIIAYRQSQCYGCILVTCFICKRNYFILYLSTSVIQHL